MGEITTGDLVEFLREIDKRAEVRLLGKAGGTLRWPGQECPAMMAFFEF